MEVKKYTQTDLRRSSAINLGKVGENNHLNLVFDVRAWMADYPDAEVVIYFKPASPGAPYIIDPTIEDGYASWVVRDVDTAFVGSGNMELILRNTDDGTVIKSVTANTKVAASPSSVPPSDSETPAGDWWSNTQSVLGNVVRYDIDMNLTDEQKERFRKNIGAGTGTGGGTGGANIDDTTPSATTTYSSQKIEAELKSQKEANATQDTRLTVLEQSSVALPENLVYYVPDEEDGTEDDDGESGGNTDSGGTSTEKPWTLLATVDFSDTANQTADISFDVDDVSEIMVFSKNMQNTGGTNSAYFLNINGTMVNQQFVKNTKSGTTNYHWAHAKYNGLVWETEVGESAIATTNLANVAPKKPYNYVLGIGKASNIAFKMGSTTYVSVTGTLDVYVR